MGVFGGLLSIDPFSQFVKILLLISAWVAILFSYQTPEVATPRRAEYYVYVLGLLLGGMFLASGNDLVLLYLAFETLGICSYILAGHMRGSYRSSEAGFKYVLYGAASSGVMLFGLTYLFGLTGTTLLTSPGTGDGIVERLASLIQHQGMQIPPDGGGRSYELALTMLPLPLFMVLAGMLYKIAAFPFHFWCPDVYEGSPLPVTGVFSVLVKSAGFAFLIRFVYSLFFTLESTVRAAGATLDTSSVVTLLALVSALTMTVGNLSALNQTNIKRMLAYSGIANCGYLLMGVALLNTSHAPDHLLGYQPEGIAAVLFFLAVYTFANLGAFVVAIAISDHLGFEEIHEYQGLGRLAPMAGVGMAVFLFSLVGMPPLAGFVAKFYLLFAVVHQGLYTLAVIAVLNSVVSLFYYARVLRAMFLEEPPAGASLELSGLYNVLILMLVLPTLGLGIFFGPLVRFANHAAATFLPMIR